MQYGDLFISRIAIAGSCYFALHLSLDIVQDKIELIAFLGGLWAPRAERAPRKAVDLYYFPLWRTTFQTRHVGTSMEALFIWNSNM